MKLPLIASAIVLALAYATPGIAASADVCPANYDPVFCPAHPAQAARATPVDRKRAHRLLEARASHAKMAKLAHPHPHDSASHIKIAAHVASPPPRPIEFRVATLDERRPSLSCEGATASVLCPGYQLMGIAY